MGLKETLLCVQIVSSGVICRKTKLFVSHDVTHVHSNQSFLCCNEQNNIQVLITPLPAGRVLEWLTGPLGPLLLILKPLCQSCVKLWEVNSSGTEVHWFSQALITLHWARGTEWMNYVFSVPEKGVSYSSAGL